MSRRPKFWLHRSSRFWWGLLLLLILLAAWLLTMAKGGRFLYNYDGTNSEHRCRIALRSGGLDLDFDHWTLAKGTGTPSPRSEWRFDSASSIGATLSAEFEWRNEHDYRSLHLFVPLWIPLLGWVFLWPLWMHRADKKEAAIFGDGAPHLDSD